MEYILKMVFKMTDENNIHMFHEVEVYGSKVTVAKQYEQLDLFGKPLNESKQTIADTKY
jgi:hypothetical protein